jgi:hypothetical protein
LLTYGESKKEAYDEVVEFKNNFRFNSHLIWSFKGYNYDYI